MIIEMALTGITWLFMGLFLILVAAVAQDDSSFQNSKAYKDLNETILNRNEDI